MVFLDDSVCLCLNRISLPQILKKGQTKIHTKLKSSKDLKK
jgi:hypothetical protein